MSIGCGIRICCFQYGPSFRAVLFVEDTVVCSTGCFFPADLDPVIGDCLDALQLDLTWRSRCRFCSNNGIQFFRYRRCRLDNSHGKSESTNQPFGDSLFHLKISSLITFYMLIIRFLPANYNRNLYGWRTYQNVCQTRKQEKMKL